MGHVANRGQTGQKDVERIPLERGDGQRLFLLVVGVEVDLLDIASGGGRARLIHLEFLEAQFPFLVATPPTENYHKYLSHYFLSFFPFSTLSEENIDGLVFPA
jgi:hypothetical protein